MFVFRLSQKLKSEIGWKFDVRFCPRYMNKMLAAKKLAFASYAWCWRSLIYFFLGKKSLLCNSLLANRNANSSCIFRNLPLAITFKPRSWFSCWLSIHLVCCKFFSNNVQNVGLITFCKMLYPTTVTNGRSSTHAYQ